MKPSLTQHARKRARQRGLREEDISTIHQYGTATCDGLILLTNKDVAAQLAELRRRMSQLERLRGAAVAVTDSEILSVYRPTRQRARRIIREGRSRAQGAELRRQAQRRGR